jgi:hypothetical protein
VTVDLDALERFCDENPVHASPRDELEAIFDYVDDIQAQPSVSKPGRSTQQYLRPSFSSSQRERQKFQPGSSDVFVWLAAYRSGGWMLE